MVRQSERPVPITQSRRVAVIGAGISGLAAAKCLLDEKLVPVVFEQAAEIGGVWNYHEEQPAGGGVMFDHCTPTPHGKSLDSLIFQSMLLCLIIQRVGMCWRISTTTRRDLDWSHFCA